MRTLTHFMTAPDEEAIEALFPRVLKNEFGARAIVAINKIAPPPSKTVNSIFGTSRYEYRGNMSQVTFLKTEGENKGGTEVANMWISNGQAGYSFTRKKN